MLTWLWAYLMPLFTSFIIASLFARWLLLSDRKVLQVLHHSRMVMLSDYQYERQRDNLIIRWVLAFLGEIISIWDLDSVIIEEMDLMLSLMGIEKRAEKVLAEYLLKGILGALPLLVVPGLTGFYGYIVLYPVGVAILILNQYYLLKKQYKNWQREVIKDLPELIDKLRICFASGRDYIAAFLEARQHSGPKLQNLISKLINDLQYMRPAQALDIFAGTFKMPVVNKFSTAVKIAIEYGYDAAESYFSVIENDIMELRQLAVEELTKSRPEKVYQLYILLMGLAIGALAIKGWEIFSRINQVF